MLENLLKLMQENAGEAIINNAAIPNAKNNAAIETATNALVKGLKNAVSTGGAQSVKNLLKDENQVTSNPLFNNLSSQVSGDLMKKFGLNKASAASIVTMLLPVVLSKLAHKTNDPGDNSFTLDGILGSLAGGSTGSGANLGKILGTLKGFLRK